MTIECPHCDQEFEVPEGFVQPQGTDLKCPKCKGRFRALPSGLTMPISPGPAAAAATPFVAPPSATGPVGSFPGAVTEFGAPGLTPLAWSSPAPFASQPFTPASGPSAATLPELPPGSELGRYTVVRLLGRGGFGVVYEVKDRLGETWALKTVPSFGDGAGLVRQLAGEYRTQRGIKDRGYVLEMDAPDVVTAANMEWVVLPMEKAEKSLREWLEETKGDLEERLEQGLDYFRQACRGVEALHGAGLFHLDLKPENLLLVRDLEAEEEARRKAKKEKQSAPGPIYRVKVADFGLARNLKKLEDVNPALLRDGVGTPLYMAPEQVLAARQKDVTAAADIYALGVLLFELLDGDPPFAGTAEEVKRKHRELEPPAIGTEVPEYLGDLVQLMLAKKPFERPGSVEELLEGLLGPLPTESELSDAVTGNDLPLFTRLVERYSSSTAKDRQEVLNETLLNATMEWCEEKDPGFAFVRLLLENKAIPTTDCWTPLLLVERFSAKRLGLIGWLLERGLRTDVIDKDGWSVLHRALSRHCHEPEACLGLSNLLSLLLSKGAPLDVACDRNGTPLCQASALLCEVLVERLLELGARTDGICKHFSWRSSALHQAYVSRHEDGFSGRDALRVMSLLLGSGADPNARVGRREWPLLWYAAKEDDLQVAKLLLSHSASRTPPTEWDDYEWKRISGEMTLLLKETRGK